MASTTAPPRRSSRGHGRHDTVPKSATTLIWLIAVIATCFGCSQRNGAQRSESVSYGSGGCGKLTGGQQVPCSAENFEAYTSLACTLGRNYLHPLVAETITEAYRDLHAPYPQRMWQYGDLGKKQGGRLKPHRTHQNGRAADFFFPILDEQQAPARVPIGLLNKMGYGLDFSSEGELDSMTVDWSAIADHLLALDTAGKSRGVSLARIILAPELQTTLFKEVLGMRRLERRFNKQRAWVVHDEHYHVVFDIPAKYRRPLGCE